MPMDTTYHAAFCKRLIARIPKAHFLILISFLVALRELSFATACSGTECPSFVLEALKDGTDRQTDRQTDRRTDERTDRQTDRVWHERGAQTDRQTDRRTDGQTDRVWHERGGQTDRQTDRYVWPAGVFQRSFGSS